MFSLNLTKEAFLYVDSDFMKILVILSYFKLLVFLVLKLNDFFLSIYLSLYK